MSTKMTQLFGKLPVELAGKTGKEIVKYIDENIEQLTNKFEDIKDLYNSLSKGMYDYSILNIELAKEDADLFKTLIKPNSDVNYIGNDETYNSLEECVKLNDHLLIQIDFEDLALDLLEIINYLSSIDLKETIYLYTFGLNDEHDLDITISNSGTSISGKMEYDNSYKDKEIISIYRIAYRLSNQKLANFKGEKKMKGLKRDIKKFLAKSLGVEFTGNTGKELHEKMVERFGQEMSQNSFCLGITAKKEVLKMFSDKFYSTDIDDCNGHYCTLDEIKEFGYTSVYIYFNDDGQEEMGFPECLQMLKDFYEKEKSTIYANLHCAFGEIEINFVDGECSISGKLKVTTRFNGKDDLVTFANDIALLYYNVDLDSDILGDIKIIF